jgi:hypothetical protein
VAGVSTDHYTGGEIVPADVPLDGAEVVPVDPPEPPRPLMSVGPTLSPDMQHSMKEVQQPQNGNHLIHGIHCLVDTTATP